MYKSESELAASLNRKFSKYSDFSIVHDYTVRLKDKTMRLDLVIEYGGKPIACVELKTKEDINNLRKHVMAILKYSGISFCFAVVKGSFRYVEPLSGKLIEKNEDDILRMLSDTVSNNTVECNELKKAFIKLINKQQQWSDYGRVFMRFLEEGCLQRCGRNVFFDEMQEKKFIRELLLKSVKKEMPKQLCRYTSAKTLYLSIHNGFRMSSVEAMNDEFETKVLDDYPNLRSSLTELPNYLNHGFILSFSAIERKDKLLQWYMYGDRAAGVCITVIPKYDNCLFWAPVVYIPKEKKNDSLTVLDFLDNLVGMVVENKYWFKLRYWHYWKFFFKYDFYREEEEVRLLIIQEENGDTAWSDEYIVPYHYISREIRNLPFEIKGVLFGPRYHDHNNLKNYISEVLGNSIEMSHSEITGYR